MEGLLINNKIKSYNTTIDNSIQNVKYISESWKKTVSEYYIEKSELTEDPRYKTDKTYWENIYIQKRKVKRVLISEDQLYLITPFNDLLQVLLSPEDTYFDFMNRGFLYAATKRKNPVYISQ